MACITGNSNVNILFMLITEGDAHWASVGCILVRQGMLAVYQKHAMCAGEGNAVRWLGSRDQEKHWPHQPAIHHPHVLRVTPASALPADPERPEEPPTLPLGQICDAVQLICGPHLSSVLTVADESQVLNGRFCFQLLAKERRGQLHPLLSIPWMAPSSWRHSQKQIGLLFSNAGCVI